MSCYNCKYAEKIHDKTDTDPNHTKRIREELGLQDPDDSKLHAKYIRHVNDNGHNVADCSACGHAMQWHDEDEDGVPRFCWFCGAKIDSVED